MTIAEMKEEPTASSDVYVREIKIH